MKKLKVMTVVGTRPEIIRLSCVIRKLDASPAIDHILVHTGQNYDYELSQLFFDELDLRQPDHFLNAAGKNGAETAGLILMRIDDVLESEQPDAFLVLGDTNSALSVIAAKKRHIPVFHMEAGNRCFDQRVPEEINRRIVDHASDINLPYSDIARGYLLNEGLRPDLVIKTGSPMYEVLREVMPKVETSTILTDFGVEADNYFVVSTHREENISNAGNFAQWAEMLHTVSETYGLPLIVSTHPRTRKMIDCCGISFSDNIRLVKPLGLADYLALQIHARAVISDSGTVSEEASILGFRALNIRQTHERPEAMEETAVMMVGLNPERVLQGLSQLEAIPCDPKDAFRTVADYAVPNVSDKIVRIILSYTDYVNRVVWSKE